MPAHLFQQTDGDWEHCCTLDRGTRYTIGRGKENCVVVGDRRCSRKHVELEYRAEGWFVRDLDSKNGTLVAGERLRGGRARLRPGDVLQVGTTRFRYAETDRAEPPAGFPEPADERSSDTASEGPGQGSVSLLLDDLREGDADAQALARLRLLQAYYDRLCRLARAKMATSRRREADEEDAVIAALGAFFVAVDEGRLPRLENRTDLWRVLVTFTVRKVYRQFEHQHARKRDVQRLVTESGLQGADDSRCPPGVQNLPDRQATDPELQAQLNDTWERFLAALGDGPYRVTAELKLQGYRNAEIARRLACSERTVERNLREIRRAWQRLFRQDDDE
jgi:DNA-directed RNA polymerase specialized sigma24 family protein